MESDNVQEVAPTTQETPVAAESVVDSTPIEQPKLVDTRSAFEIAFEAVKDKEEQKAAALSDKLYGEKKAPTKEEPKVVQADDNIPPLEPPAEFSKEEKEDFILSSRKQQEASLRLHRSRLAKAAELNKFQQENAKAYKDIETYKELAKRVDPFVKAQGMKYSPEVAIQKALEMYHTVDGAQDPRPALMEILRAKGMEDKIPADWLQESPANNIPSSEIKSLQEELKVLKEHVVGDLQRKHYESFTSDWQSFAQEKNAAGAPKFPDISDTEAGTRLASKIGSLVNGVSELSKQFIAEAQERIPGIDRVGLLKEAYRWAGGRVDESTAAPRSQMSQDPKHIAKARRASSSVPGSGIAPPSPIKKFKSNREALAYAYALQKEQ